MNKVGNVLKSIAITSEVGREILKQAKLIEGIGIENDQVRSEIRQVSIVSDKFFVNNYTNKVGFCHKKFKENLIIMHLDVDSLDILDKIYIGEAVLEITQVFKKCYENCPNYDENESCQANKEVIFAKVVKTGYIKKDDLAIVL